MSWFPSWIPTLPSISFALPASIQGRFISFVLKKSLGHLVKPGQLDIDQIDSQIGSGYVQVNDIQLDDQSINSALLGLPIQLHEGSISRVTARIPWPNPLTSTVGLSLDSLNLTFHVLPSSASAPSASQNLADSVASVADSFIHDELSTKEETALRESFHPDLVDDHNVPGGLDPFIYAPEEREFHGEADPPGISLFASLIERLLARFEFDAVNTKITLIHPDHTSFSICVPEIIYRTESRSNEEDASQQELSSAGETRMITVSGLSVTARNLRSLVAQAATPLSSHMHPDLLTTALSPPHTPRPASPASSSSSLDDDAQFAMSQSLAFLPPRSISPTSSVASSMYHSAISEGSPEADEEMGSGDASIAPAPIIEPSPSVPFSEYREPTSSSEVIFSLGPDPLVLRLQTPASQGASSPHSIIAPGDLKLTLETGVIGCALRPWHITGVMGLFDVVTKASPSKETVSTRSENPAGADAQGPAMNLEMRIRGAVMVLLPPGAPDTGLLVDFFQRPHIPPKFPSSYLRVHLESVAASLVLGTAKLGSSDGSDFTLSLGDMSALVFHHTVTGDSLSASPLLITDHHLSAQYPVSHHHSTPNDADVSLPTFEVIDWTDPTHGSVGMKVSHWRTKFHPKSAKLRRGSRVETTSLVADRATNAQLPPAILITGKRHMLKGTTSTTVEVIVEPLHVFLDLGYSISGALPFLDELAGQMQSSSTAMASEDDFSDEDSDEDTPPASPRARISAKEREKERRRLEKMVLEDLNLDLDYKIRPHSTSKVPKRRRRTERSKTTVSIKTEMFRVQLRCPSGATSRSGALVIDFHNVDVSLGASKSTTRFASQTSVPFANTGDNESLLSVELQRIVVAGSGVKESMATAFLSIGPLASENDEDAEFPALLPRITVSQSTRSHRSSPSTVAVVAQIPSVLAHISKPLLDGLQYLADDVTQLLQRAFASEGGESRNADGQDSGLIGSRFFAKSRTGSMSSGSTIRRSRTNPPESTSVLKTEITEGKFSLTRTWRAAKDSAARIRIMLPRESASVLPFDINASDLEVLVELKPQGKDQTIITVVAMGMEIKDSTAAGVSEPLLSLTAPRGLASAARPLVKLVFTSLVVPETTAKESRIRVALWGFTCNLTPDIRWTSDLGLFFKPPPGAFEAVIPTERTHISLNVSEGSVRISASSHPGALVIHAGALEFSTSVDSDSPDSTFRSSVTELAILMIDNLADATDPDARNHSGVRFWRKSGFALLTEVFGLDLVVQSSKSLSPPDTSVLINRLGLRLHLCADSLTAVGEFAQDLATSFKPVSEEDFILRPKPEPAVLSQHPVSHESLMASVDDMAFNRLPQVGSAPDMIDDDLPTNSDYLDESFGAAAGLREFRDEDLDEFHKAEETVKMLRPEGLRIVEHHFDTLPPDTSNGSPNLGSTNVQVRVHKADVTLFLYDGYDWVRTRKTIEEQVKEMRRRLAKIRQLVAGGQTQDPSFEGTSTVLFNSVYIGLDQDVDELEPAALIAAIDEELKDDFETISQSSWQSLRPAAGIQPPPTRSPKVHGKRLTRSKAPSIEFQLMGVKAEVDQYSPNEPLVSRTLVTIKDLEILDHIKTSTWKKFLTQSRSDARGNIRETDSNMVRVELRSLRPVPSHPSEEARLRAKILPLRLYVDQDALDFLKKFFSFKDSQSPSSAESASDSDGGIYFQLAEIFPVDLKLDYKPRRVDYRALREGKTIELMNFFHFDGAEMTLRHITLAGITGWPRLFDMLNDLWTPDVKATQLVDVISGVAPIRSMVNVGSGVADLVLLPIAQYKKDGRIVRGVQKGTTAFFQSTAVEAIKLGARLATGTQVILEQAEGMLGGKNSIETETIQPTARREHGHYGQSGSDEEDEPEDLISIYAEQPVDLREGVQSAYKSLQRNLSSAAQTILAVPMEVYERSGNEGPVKSVIRAVPIAVLKPMIGASEAVSKTLLGLHNTLDPNVRHENEAKYKQR